MIHYTNKLEDISSLNKSRMHPQSYPADMLTLGEMQIHNICRLNQDGTAAIHCRFTSLYRKNIADGRRKNNIVFSIFVTVHEEIRTIGSRYKERKNIEVEL